MREKSATRSATRRGVESLAIGWREFVGLPDLGIAGIRAKIDSGARTSALHADDIETWNRDDGLWVTYRVPLPGKPAGQSCLSRVIDQREIKNTSGVPERRYVINTTLVLGRRHWHIEISLADRAQMGFDLILGRTAIRRHRIVIDPGKSFLAGPPVAFATAVPVTPVRSLGAAF